MENEEVDFWNYLIMENANFLLRKQEAQGTYTHIINVEELVQEVTNHIGKTTGIKSDNEIRNFIYQHIQEKSLGINLWEIKKGSIIPVTHLADIFLKMANELFSEEKRRIHSVLRIDELVQEVIAHLSKVTGEEISNENKVSLYTILDRICTEYKYLKKIKNDYIIFDENGRKRLKELVHF